MPAKKSSHVNFSPSRYRDTAADVTKITPKKVDETNKALRSKYRESQHPEKFTTEFGARIAAKGQRDMEKVWREVDSRPGEHARAYEAQADSIHNKTSKIADQIKKSAGLSKKR